jgi:hypothetical protein
MQKEEDKQLKRLDLGIVVGQTIQKILRNILKHNLCILDSSSCKVGGWKFSPKLLDRLVNIFAQVHGREFHAQHGLSERLDSKHELNNKHENIN